MQKSHLIFTIILYRIRKNSDNKKIHLAYIYIYIHTELNAKKLVEIYQKIVTFSDTFNKEKLSLGI